MPRNKLKLVLLTLVFLLSFLLLNFASKHKIPFLSRAFYQRANLIIDAKEFIGPLQHNWQALAQGGEESNGLMLDNVALTVAELKPRYIRIDHIYDFYNVVSRAPNRSIVLDFVNLDRIVCDIYRTGAKPFFVLGYMPPTLSGNDNLISAPKNWQEWAFVVQKTVERYSGTKTQLCGGITPYQLTDVYYEVWNEPDLEGFGKWSIYGGAKDYRALYYYAVKGAQAAQNVYRFSIGGPATTRPYQNWFKGFLTYVKTQNLRVDFLSWHHYSKSTQDFFQEVSNVHQWLKDPLIADFQNLPLVISEWGYDSNPNPIADTNVGAAHTVATIRNLVDQKVELAFAFEIKDGLNPSWGIFTYEGQPKPRFYALNLLNNLSRHRLAVSGEGTYVKALASYGLQDRLNLIIVNYDPDNHNTELVPLTVYNVKNGRYRLIQRDLTNQQLTTDFEVNTGQIQRNFLMPANQVLSLEIFPL